LPDLLSALALPRLLPFGMTIWLILVSAAASAQTVPSWVGNLLLQNSTITADPTLTAPEAQGLGLKFELLFAMVKDHDPLNSDNDTISVVTTTAYPAGIGVAVRNMLPNAKVATLTNQLSIKYYFPARSCSGGSPRFQLRIDPGDGTPPRNAFGYVGHGGFGTGCLTGVWDFVDMTDSVPFRWISRSSAVVIRLGLVLLRSLPPSPIT